MSKKFYADVDINKNQLLQYQIEHGTSFPVATPGSGGAGQPIPVGYLFRHDTNGHVWVYDNVSKDILTPNDPTDIGSAGWRRITSNVLELVEGTAIDISDLSTDNRLRTISVDPSGIKHSALDHDEDGDGTLDVNPHNVSLEDVLNVDPSAENKKITNLPEGTESTDSVNLGQLVSISAGVVWHDPVRVATTEAIILIGTVTTSIDGIPALTVGDRVLVKDQGIPLLGNPPLQHPDNGIYIFNGASVNYSRAVDMDTAGSDPLTNEFNRAAVLVESGLVNIGREYKQVNTVTLLGTDPVKFIHFGGTSVYKGGDGMTLDGNTFNVNTPTLSGIDVTADNIAVEGSEVAGNGLIVDSGNAYQVNVNPDDSSLEVSSDTIPVVQIKAKGVEDVHLNVNVAGIGLTGADGSALEVKPYLDTTKTDTPQKAPVFVDANGVAVEIDNDTIKHTAGILRAIVPTGDLANVLRHHFDLLSNGDEIIHTLGNKFVSVTVYQGDEVIEVGVLCEEETDGTTKIIFKTTLSLVHVDVILVG